MPRTKQFDQQAAVDQAIALFTAQGYHGTTAQDLVDALGLSRSSLYDTFGDKHGLFLRALEQYGHQSTRALRELLASSPDLPATLRRLFDQLIEENAVNGPQGGCLMTNTATAVGALSAAAGQLVRAGTLPIEEALAAAIAQAQQAGTVGTRHGAQALARSLHASIVGLRVMAKAGASQEALEDIARLALAAL